MAKKTNTYSPSAEIEELVRRYFNGDQSTEVVNTIKALMAKDANFGTYFKQLQAQMKSMQGRGKSWSVGTHGSQMSGDNGQVRFNKGASAWNQYRMSRAGGYGNAPTSPGGFKSSGRDEDSALRRGGEMTPDVIKSKVKVDFDKGTATFNGQKYSKAQLDAILKRGMSGATMNWKDQAIYDKLIQYGANMDDAKNARLNEMRDAAVDRDALAAEEARRRQEADAADVLKRNRDFEDWKRQKDYEASLKSAESSDKSRKDALDYASKLVKAGTHEWTKEQQEEMRRLQSEINRLRFGRDKETVGTSPEKREETAAQLQRMIEDIRMNPMERIVPEETLEERVAKNRWTDENGLVWAMDANGSPKVVYDPKDYEREYKRQELEDKRKIDAQNRADARADAVQKRKDAWLDARIAALQTPTKGKDDLGMDTDIPGLSYEEAYKQAMEEMDIRFPKPEEEVGEIPDYLKAHQQLGYEVKMPLSPSGFDAQGQRTFGGEEEIVEQPPASPVANKWAHRAMGGDANQGAEVLPTQVEVQGFGSCPICGYPLDENGFCKECGYSDEEAEEFLGEDGGIE